MPIQSVCLWGRNRVRKWGKWVTSRIWSMFSILLKYPDLGEEQWVGTVSLLASSFFLAWFQVVVFNAFQLLLSAVHKLRPLLALQWPDLSTVPVIAEFLWSVQLHLCIERPLLQRWSSYKGIFSFWAFVVKSSRQFFLWCLFFSSSLSLSLWIFSGIILLLQGHPYHHRKN